MTPSRVRAAALAAVVVLLLGVAAWFVFSPETKIATSAPTRTDDVAATTSDAKPESPRATTRKRDSGEKPEEPETTPPPADDPSKWPVRVLTNVPGATVTMQVRLYGGAPDPAPSTKTTDANGFVGFAAPPKDVPVHEFEFVARAEGRTTALASLSEPGEVKMELHTAVAIRGFVRDEAGRGVGGARVSFHGSTFTVNDRPTAADGSFEVFAEQAGAVDLYVNRIGFLSQRKFDVEAPAAGIVVVLERGSEVSGRVTFPNGLPVPGVRVSVRYGSQATTDADGRYVLSGLAPGEAELKCEFVDEARHVETGSTNVDFVVGQSVARIRFIDAEGRPFRHAATTIRVTKGDAVLRMSAGYGAGESDDQLVSGDSGSTVLVSASSPDGRTGSGKATFDETPRLHGVDVVLGTGPTGAIRLLVRWEAAETPKAVYVAVTDETGGTVAGDARKRFDLDAAGAVEIPSVPAGHVKVTVAAAAHWSSEALDTLLVTATSAAEVQVGRTTEVVATLSVGGRVRATVRDEAGEAVAPDIVRLQTASDRRVVDMFVHRSAGGGWTSALDTSPSDLIDAVPAGRYVVRASMSDGRDGEKEVDVVKGRIVDVEVTLKPTR